MNDCKSSMGGRPGNLALCTAFVAVMLSLAGCRAGQPVDGAVMVAGTRNEQGASSRKSSATEPKQEASCDLGEGELDRFTPAQHVRLAAETSDLNGDGAADAVVVLAPSDEGGGMLGEGPPRSVLLLICDGTGRLRLALRNDRLVPCASCGGLLGDPFGSLSAEGGKFTVSTTGGSRERWWNEYTFQYSSRHDNWLLSRAVRGVMDPHTGKEAVQELGRDDFGDIFFGEFDESLLPSVIEE